MSTSHINPPAASVRRPPDEAAAPAMPEVDLLPAWYPQLVRRRRQLVWQAWGTGALGVILFTILLLRQGDVQASEHELAQLVSQRRETDAMLVELHRERQRLDRYSSQLEVIREVGLPIEVSRVIAAIDESLPPGGTLTSLAVRTETRRQGITDSRPRQRDEGPAAAEFRFSVVGHTREDNDLAHFYDRLVDKPLLRDVKINYARRETSADSSATAFEITFLIDLALGAGAGGQAGSTSSAGGI